MIESLEQLISDQSFRRFVSGEADDSEKIYWSHWINSDTKHQQMYEEAVFLLTKFRVTSRVETDDEKDWADVEHLINSEADKIRQLPSLQKKGSTLSFLLRYAAIILIISLAGISYWLFPHFKDDVSASHQLADVTVETGFRELKTINLYDGSKIILAPNSKLTHKANWLSKHVKELKLSGEAYFDISDKNKQSGKAKFKIVTPQGVVRDYGTKFDVSTFDDKTLVVLEYGIVSVSKVKERKTSTRMLDVGQMALISNQQDNIDIKKVNTRVYTSWRTKTLFFDNTPLPFFLSYLKNFYGKSIVVRDSTLLNKRLSDGIDRGSVKSMLNVISHVLSIKMYQQGDTVYVGGDSSGQTNP